MKIKRSSWHCKISNWGGGAGSNDNLCRYFWRMVFKIVMTVTLVTALCFLAYEFYKDITGLIVIMWIISTVFLPPLAIWTLRNKLGRSPRLPYEESVFDVTHEFIKAWKGKFCPMIEYIDK